MSIISIIYIYIYIYDVLFYRMLDSDDSLMGIVDAVTTCIKALKEDLNFVDDNVL